MTNLVGTTLGQYQIVELIGEGGMAHVYKAWQPSLRRYVALKVLAPHLSSDAEFLKRFRQEAVSAANLKHTSIVTIHDVGVEDSQHYIAMEYIEGESLSERIRSGQVIAPDKVVDIVSQIGSALDYAHQQGFIHRDIKPANVLIEPSGRAVLTDFGIAKAVSGRGITGPLTQAGSIFGTPHYMSPEQVREEKLDHRSDLYSLGIVCYEMLTGEVPFDGTTTHSILYAQANSPPPPLRDANPAVSPPVEAVVGKMLAKDRERRYDSAGAFAMALARAVEGVWPEEIGEATLVGSRASTGTELMDTVIGPGVEQDATVLTRRAPVGAPVRRRRWPRVLGMLLLLVMLAAAVGVGWWMMYGVGESIEVKLVDAQAMLTDGRYEEAIKAFEEVLLKEADNIAALRGIAEVCEAQGQWQQAVGWYEKWSQLAPDDVMAQLGLGWMLYKVEEYEQAAAQFSKAAALRSGWPDGFEGLGKSYYQLGDYEQAVGAIEQWLELDSQNDQAHYLLGNSYYNLSNYQEAVGPLETYVHSNPTEDVHRRLGWSYFHLERYEDAIAQFSAALQFEESANAYQGLGNCYYKLKKYQDAADASSQWIASEPNNARAHRLLGLSRYFQGEYEMAVEAFDNSLQFEEDAVVYRYLGLSYKKLKDYQESIQAFEKWSNLSPNDGEAFLELGWVYFSLEQYDDAIPLFQRAIELDVAIAEAYQGLGASYSELDNYQSALAAYELWTEVDPENAWAFRAVGRMHLVLQEYEEAVFAFTRSLQLQERDDVYYLLAEAYRRQGNCKEAIPNYEQALELKSGEATYEEGLEQCR